MPGQERRRAGRRRLAATVEVLDGSGAQTTRGIARDIGSHGMALYPQQPLAVGERVTLRFDLPTSSWCLELEARVVRSFEGEEGAAVALEFLDAPEWAVAEVTRFVSRAVPRKPPEG